MKRRIKIPPPVSVVQIDGEPVNKSDGTQMKIAFLQFVRERSCDDAFSAGATGTGFTMDDILAAARVCERVEKANGHVELEEADYERLLRATKTPKSGYHPAAARNALPFMMAIVSAEVPKE